METRVYIRGVEEPGSLREFAQEKLGQALERFQDRVLSATMRLEDVTGPDKGGIDKLCSVEVKLRTGEVRIKEQGEDFYATIDIAIDRLKTALSREVGRTKRGVGEG